MQTSHLEIGIAGFDGAAYDLLDVLPKVWEANAAIGNLKDPMPAKPRMMSLTDAHGLYSNGVPMPRTKPVVANRPPHPPKKSPIHFMCGFVSWHALETLHVVPSLQLFELGLIARVS